MDWREKTTKSFNVQTCPAPLTLNANINFPWVPLFFDGYGFQIEWTGVPNGNFMLEGSFDPILPGTDIKSPDSKVANVANPINHGAVAGTVYIVVVAGKNAWNIDGAKYNFVRLVYTDSSGGTSAAQIITAICNQKGP